jgi:PAS domain S-box-containing protein
MKKTKSAFLLPKGVTARISSLSWMITLSTLTIFVTASLPEQKRELLDGLESKARGVTSSLREATAGAAVTEDYSSVVEACVQALAADAAIEYVVIVKNDGFAVIVDRKGWRTEKLGRFWVPPERTPAGRIEKTPLSSQRMFHFSIPFDYSSIQWGWIHVGLSTAAYDGSVARLYQRTAILAVLCVAMSLLASVIYAKQLVRPIRSLEAVVRRIAAGDLSARAAIHTGDEIELLAESFNGMAESLLQRDRIVESVRFAAQQFLSVAGWQTVILDVLAKIGVAAQAGRVFVFESHPGEDTGLVGTVRYEWLAPGSHGPASRAESRREWRGPEWQSAAQGLRRGELILAPPATPPNSSEPSAHALKSSILVPIEVAGQWFGFLAFEDYLHERQWSDAERDSFRAAAGMLGASITRQQAQDYVDNILRSMEESLIVTDPELRIRRVNPRTLRLLGYTEEELIGKPAGLIVTGGDVPERSSGIERAYRTKAGQLIPVLFSSAQLRSGLGLLEGFVCLGQDMTERKRAQEELVRTRDAAEQANRSKSTFLANMSHELRTPLNAIIGYSQMLQEDCDGAASSFRPDLEKIERSGHMLLGLINDILDISKIEAGRTEVRVETIDIAPVLEEVRNTMLPMALKCGNQLEVACPEEARQASADLAKFRQSLLNLVNNACKFTENGRVTVTVENIREGPRPFVAVRVADTGIGISREHLSRLFQPFSQVDGSATRKYGGTGLGLAISKKFCQMMGGDILVESEPGQGSRFSILLPAAEEIGEARKAG